MMTREITKQLKLVLSTIIDYDIKGRILLNRKNESGYFILAVFTIFGILAVASIPGIILGITMSLSNTREENYVSEQIWSIAFAIIVFYGIPIILTIIQFFRNKELFAIQTFFIFIAIIALITLTLQRCTKGT